LGVAGIVVPSFAVGVMREGCKLVLWRRGRERLHRVQAIDPDGRLPKDAVSWSGLGA
jgi:RES domain-containing protein